MKWWYGGEFACGLSSNNMARKKHVQVKYDSSDSNPEDSDTGNEGSSSADSVMDDEPDVELASDADDGDSDDNDGADDAEKENDSNDDEGGEVEHKKSGLADAMAKILKKNIPIHQQVILAKAKTDREIRKRKLTSEIKVEGKDSNEEKKTEKVKSDRKRTKKVKDEDEVLENIASQERKRLWEDMCRVKPDPLQRDKERQLQKIGTRGVVQLFNAVRKQQKLVEDKLTEVGSSDRKQAKVMETVTKGSFMGLLKGASKNSASDEKKTKIKVEKSDEEADSKEKKWDILREDFMMGAKMKDWDKDSSGDDSGPDEGPPDISDSD